MGGKSGATVLRDVHRLFQSGTVAGVSDGDLLARFAQRGDEAAFEALMARHGPMVLGVCRQLLRDPDDAADAFQATLLVFVRKAQTVRVRDTLGPWFYGVAYRVAARARARTSARHDRERADGVVEVADRPVDPDRTEVAALLHQELSRLPDRLRAPIVLCHLEGQTHAQAAARLGCPIGTVRSRLARGREQLRGRLEHRGLDGCTLLAAPWPLACPPAVPLSLVESTLAAARAGGAALAVSAPVAALTEGVLTMMVMSKVKVVAAVVLATGLVAAGAGTAVRAYQAPGTAPAGSVTAAAAGAESSLRGGAHPPVKMSREDREAFDKLRAPVSLNVDRQPLGEVITTLSKQTGQNIVIDPKALSDQNVTTQSPVSLTASNIALENALKILLAPLGLTYQVEVGVVLVTSPPASPPAPRVDQAVPLPPPPNPGKPPTLEQKLDRTVTIHLGQCRIGEALQVLRAPDFDLVFDPNGLTKAGVNLETRVTLDAIDAPLKSVLTSMLKPIGLDYRLEGDKFVVIDAIAPQTLAKTYYVGDLVVPLTRQTGAPIPSGRVVKDDRPKVDLKPIIELITSSVAPGTWRVVDSSGNGAVKIAPADDRAIGSITPFYLSISVIIRHTPEVHDQVSALLKRLRRVMDARESTHEEPLQVTTPPAPADGPRLELTLSGPKRPGSTLHPRFEVEVVNRGTATAHNVFVLIQLPQGSQPYELPKQIRFNPLISHLMWNQDHLDQGAKAHFAFDVRIGQAGPAVIFAQANADNLSPVPSAPLRLPPDQPSEPDIAVEVSPEYRTIEVGDTTTYTFHVTNTGPRGAAKVMLSAELSANLEPVETSGTQKNALIGADNHQVVFPAIGYLEPNRWVDLTLKVKATQRGAAVCRTMVRIEGSPDALESASSCRVIPRAE